MHADDDLVVRFGVLRRRIERRGRTGCGECFDLAGDVDDPAVPARLDVVTWHRTGGVWIDPTTRFSASARWSDMAGRLSQ
ncbi:hypothetical protein ACQPW3_11635 [Actinosynnema sp. CA-248983]